MVFPVVQAGNISEILAAGLMEGLCNLFVDFLKRFDAIGRKRGGNYRDVLLACGGKAGDLFDGIGLKPFFPSEAGLKG